MNRSTQDRVAWIVSAALVAALVAGYYTWRWIAAPDVRTPATETSVAEPTPAPPVQPAIRHPIELVPQGADAATPLPSLESSDAELQDSLSRLIGRIAFRELVRPDDIVRHIVATVDNLPRKTLAPRLSPVKPVPGPFVASGATDATLAAANVSRYTPYVVALESVDTHKLAAAYAYFYPLFQQAYRELGYPDRYFNDRLVEVIDVMLATPELSGQVALAQPRVLHQFADPDLEALPSGQKIMLRMGPENAARVKRKLTEIRQVLTGRSAQAPAQPPAALPSDVTNAPSAPAPSSKTTSGG